MSDTGVIATVSPRDYDAVLFDLDGILTRTASVHAAVWKKPFDAFLERRTTEMGEPFVAFDIEADYRRYVDGRPRYDGVAAFLAARSLELPAGTREDGPSLHGCRRRWSGSTCGFAIAGIRSIYGSRVTP